MKTLKFKTNIHCSGCITTVTPIFEKISEIEKWNVDLESPEKVLTVSAREGFSPQKLNAELGGVGYFAEAID